MVLGTVAGRGCSSFSRFPFVVFVLIRLGSLVDAFSHDLGSSTLGIEVEVNAHGLAKAFALDDSLRAPEKAAVASHERKAHASMIRFEPTHAGQYHATEIGSEELAKSSIALDPESVVSDAGMKDRLVLPVVETGMRAQGLQEGIGNASTAFLQEARRRSSQHAPAKPKPEEDTSADEDPDASGETGDVVGAGDNATTKATAANKTEDEEEEAQDSSNATTKKKKAGTPTILIIGAAGLVVAVIAIGACVYQAQQEEAKTKDEEEAEKAWEQSKGGYGDEWANYEGEGEYEEEEEEQPAYS